MVKSNDQLEKEEKQKNQNAFDARMATTLNSPSRNTAALVKFYSDHWNSAPHGFHFLQLPDQRLGLGQGDKFLFVEGVDDTNIAGVPCFINANGSIFRVNGHFDKLGRGEHNSPIVVTEDFSDLICTMMMQKLFAELLAGTTELEDLTGFAGWSSDNFCTNLVLRKVYALTTP